MHTVPPRATSRRAWSSVAPDRPTASNTTVGPAPPVSAGTITNGLSPDSWMVSSAALVCLAMSRTAALSPIISTCCAPSACAAWPRHSPIVPHPITATVWPSTPPTRWIAWMATPKQSASAAPARDRRGGIRPIVLDQDRVILGEAVTVVRGPAQHAHPGAQVRQAQAALPALPAGDQVLGLDGDAL